MFTLPQYWWLLALLLLPQAIFGLALLSSLRKKRPLPSWAILLLGMASLLGIMYGLVQHDAVFVLGQACVLAMLYLYFNNASK